jgi:hypothetical protein
LEVGEYEHYHRRILRPESGAEAGGVLESRNVNRAFKLGSRDWLDWSAGGHEYQREKGMKAHSIRFVSR